MSLPEGQELRVTQDFATDPDFEELAKHPFGQGEVYFSESQRQLIRIEDMIPQYALNVFRKLCREYEDEFRYSPLYDALLAHIMPSSASLSDVLRQHGKALMFCGMGRPSVNAARKRLRRAGATETHLAGEFVEGTREVDLAVNVSKVRR